ncbi:hypothetical protein BESB_015700 [Besnoitia besnoiti]|uniref:Uncharacterized protein n=1 Tax=Besnoitia besnoiti TaxID=94643 RepID=A0A2A9MA34_BESBE|nr:hypothetical protein BESB_015700 [Besnoitia besnoiti]PFH32252.1 hypothetical protein BESB_015700 [Besnoitia besnoiti]
MRLYRVIARKKLARLERACWSLAAPEVPLLSHEARRLSSGAGRSFRKLSPSSSATATPRPARKAKAGRGERLAEGLNEVAGRQRLAAEDTARGRGARKGNWERMGAPGGLSSCMRRINPLNPTSGVRRAFLAAPLLLSLPAKRKGVCSSSVKLAARRERAGRAPPRCVPLRLDYLSAFSGEYILRVALLV